jgi:excisionase family DNA binding protein
MANAGRAKEESALREAAQLVGRLDQGVLTIPEAAERLGMPERAIEEWIGRGGLDAVKAGGRWLVSAEDVASAIRLRDTLREMDQEGYPTYEEIDQMYSRRRSKA